MMRPRHFASSGLCLMAASAFCQANPLTTVLNQNKLSSVPLAYQQRVQPGAMLELDASGGPQYPDPVQLLDTLKVLNEQPFLAHSDIKVATQKSFFISLLNYDPSAKVSGGSAIEVDQTDFLSTSITDGQMEKLVYHDMDFKAAATQVLDDGGVPYLVESVWLGTKVHVSQATSKDLGLALGKNLPGCTASYPTVVQSPTTPATPVQPVATPPGASPTTPPAVPTSPTSTHVPAPPAPTNPTTLATVPEAVATAVTQPIVNSVKSLSNAVVNAVDATSKAVANAATSSFQLGYEGCRNTSSVVEFTSTRPVPIAVKLQRIFRNPQKPNGLDYVGDVHNF